MQNPLRRPRGDGPAPNNRDLERNRKADAGILDKGVRGHLVAMSGEFVGTVMFLYFAFAATQIANTIGPVPNLNQLLFISLAFGFSLLVTAWVFYRISGGLFNPAVRTSGYISTLTTAADSNVQVTFGMVITGTLPPIRGLLLFPAQMLGGMVAAGLVSCMFPGTLAVETTLTQGTSVVQGLFIEMFCTAELVFAILMLAAEKSKATFIAPVGIGLALFVAELGGTSHQ